MAPLSQSVVPSKQVAECPNCHGGGVSSQGRCLRCNGSGKLVIRESPDGSITETTLLYD